MGCVFLGLCFDSQIDRATRSLVTPANHPSQPHRPTHPHPHPHPQPPTPGIDSSAPAVALATANARANALQDRVAFFKDDVSAFMKAAVERGDGWDVVVLDPPKLAPNRWVRLRMCFVLGGGWQRFQVGAALLCFALVGFGCVCLAVFAGLIAWCHVAAFGKQKHVVFALRKYS